MRFIQLVFIAASTVLAASSASIGGDKLEVVRYQLNNGLEVVLAPDHKVPKVGLTLIYRVGGMNEPAGRSGFAHLFEHLMFSGTAKYPDIDATYSALGVVNNASTPDDRTTYVASALASALPVMLSVEADRMANLGREVDQAELDIQRDVVKNEMREKVLDSAGQPGMEAFRTALFPAPHPYAESGFGSMADLDAASLDEVKAFFDLYYVPNNAILSLAGDFEVEAVKALIAETFGRVPRGADVALPVASTPEHVALRLEATDRLPAPMVVMGVAGPGVDSKESKALTIAGDMLGNYEYGVLRRELVGRGLAVNAAADWSAGRLGGRFIISATAAPGVSPADLEAAMRKAVADFAARELDDEVAVERVRRLILLDRRMNNESMLGRAQTLATSVDLFGSTDAALGDDPVLAGLTAADVGAAFRAAVTPESLSVLTIVPGERGDYPAVLKESSGVAQPLVAPSRPPVDIPTLAAGETAKAVLPEMETATLSNGIRAVHYKSTGSPMAFVAAMVGGGTGDDAPGKEGLIGLATDLMSRGAGDRNYEAFSKAAADIGAGIFGFSDFGQAGMVLAVSTESFAPGVELLADSVLRPRFEAAEWSVLQQEMQQALMYRNMDPSNLAYNALEEALFPLESGRPALQPSIASIGRLTLEEIREAHARLFTPRTMTLYSVGALDLDEVVTLLEKAFGGWTSEAPGLAGGTHPPAEFDAPTRVLVTPTTGNSQAVIYLARRAPAFDDPGIAEAIAVSRLFGSDAVSRLNRVLRETKGYSYGLDASVWTHLKTGGVLSVMAPVQADKVGASLHDILAGFSGLSRVPVTQVELERTIMASASSTAAVMETGSGLFGFVLGAATVGLTAGELNERYQDIVDLKLPEVQAMANELAGTDNSIVVIAGDPASIVSQLAEIGISDVTVLPPEE